MMSQTEQVTTGLTTVQLEQLCQAQQIERTMYLLFLLNHWAKARERLFYVDRQGLYAIKRAIIRQAFMVGVLIAHCYIDGIEGFGAELAFDMAADIAAESCLWRLEELVTPPLDPEEDPYDRIVRQFYTKMTGRETFSVTEIERLDVPQVRDYILKRLLELELTARLTRQPIPGDALRDLCIAPSDLLYMQDRRWYDLGNWDSWDQLDESDLRKLDPEGLSLIAFRYVNPHASYTFHLPLRVAETFMPAQQIDQLKGAPRTSRESGEYYGRAITEAESLQHPIADILRELGVNIAAVCPRLLSDKQEFVHLQHMRFLAWNEEADEEEDDEEELDELFWQEADKPAAKQTSRPASVRIESDACPSCPDLFCVVPGHARIEHWHLEHANQDLTISQASWVLNRSMGKEEFCKQYPPDYRSQHERGWGTRYWKIETLEKWANAQEAGG